MEKVAAYLEIYGLLDALDGMNLPADPRCQKIFTLGGKLLHRAWEELRGDGRVGLLPPAHLLEISRKKRESKNAERPETPAQND